MCNKPGLMCWRVDMHFNNSDKLDLTANHGQQWLRTLRAVVCLTLQRGYTKTSVHVCVSFCLNGLVLVKVWNRSDRKHLLFLAVTCYPFSQGESGEPFFLPASGCQHRLSLNKRRQPDSQTLSCGEHLPVTPASQADRCHDDREMQGPGSQPDMIQTKLLVW